MIQFRRGERARWFLSAACAAVVGATLSAGCTKLSGDDEPVQSDDVAASPESAELSAEQMAALGIAVESARAAKSVWVTGLPAEIVAPMNASARVAAPFAGVVTRVHVDEGQDVEAGQALVRIQSRELLAAVAEAVRAEKEAVLAAQQAKRDAQLLEEGIISESRNEATAARAAIADAARRQARGALSGLRPVSDGAPGEYDLLAPMKGRVLHRSIVPGQSLAALDETFSIAAPGPLDLMINVPVSLRPQLVPGLTVMLPDGKEALVQSVGADADRASQSLRVRARIDAGTAFLPGQHLHVALLLPAPAGSVEVPASALIPAGKGMVLYVQEGETFRAVEVQRLGENGAVAVVHGDIAPETRIVTRGTSALRALIPAAS